MSLYDRYLLPPLIDLAMRTPRLQGYRRALVAQARGEVLEVGIGSGLNLPHYQPDAVSHLYGLDPAPRLLAMARRRARHCRFPVTLLEGGAEAIPLADASIDTVLSTWTLCSIPGLQASLQELSRVLRPGGRFLFVEHGLAPDPAVRRWQQRLTPLWSRVSGGCHLDRPIDELLQQAGFRLEQLETGYLMRGLRLLTYMYAGRAGR